MPTMEAVTQSILSRWNTQWGVTTTFSFDNEKKDPPKDQSSWVYLEIHPDFPVPGGQETLGPVGSRKYIRRGAVIMTVFVKAGSGISAINTLVPAARAIFEGVSFSSVNFGDTIHRRIGSDGYWFVHLVQAPFWYEEIK